MDETGKSKICCGEKKKKGRKKKNEVMVLSLWNVE